MDVCEEAEGLVKMDGNGDIIVCEQLINLYMPHRGVKCPRFYYGTVEMFRLSPVLLCSPLGVVAAVGPKAGEKVKDGGDGGDYDDYDYDIDGGDDGDDYPDDGDDAGDGGDGHDDTVSRTRTALNRTRPAAGGVRTEDVAVGLVCGLWSMVFGLCSLGLRSQGLAGKIPPRRNHLIPFRFLVFYFFSLCACVCASSFVSFISPAAAGFAVPPSVLALASARPTELSGPATRRCL